MKLSLTSLLAVGAAIALIAGLTLASLGAPALADRGGEPNSNSGDHSSGGSDNGGGNSGGDVGAAGGSDIGTGFSGADPGSVGPTISGEIYGNTSNPRPSGHGVLPSLSPGPWVCDGPDCSAQPTAPGGSMGEFLAPTASDGKGNPDFANSKTPGPDFSEPNKP
jgi:hypothetical protein